MRSQITGLMQKGTPQAQPDMNTSLGHYTHTHTHTHTHAHRWRVKHSKHGEGERSKEYRVQCTDVEDRVTGFEAQFYPIITVASVSSSVK